MKSLEEKIKHEIEICKIRIPQAQKLNDKFMENVQTYVKDVLGNLLK